MTSLLRTLNPSQNQGVILITGENTNNLVARSPETDTIPEYQNTRIPVTRIPEYQNASNKNTRIPDLTTLKTDDHQLSS